MQTRASAEKQYAEFYSLWVADFRKDTSLYLDLAAKYAGPVLEIGCGTGRVLSRLGEAGYEVELVDGEHGVSPGQACVFYDAGIGQARVLGGGFIKSAIKAADIAPATDQRITAAARG